jgi:hypothetical protein
MTYRPLSVPSLPRLVIDWFLVGWMDWTHSYNKFKYAKNQLSSHTWFDAIKMFVLAKEEICHPFRHHMSHHFFVSAFSSDQCLHRWKMVCLLTIDCLHNRNGDCVLMFLFIDFLIREHFQESYRNKYTNIQYRILWIEFLHWNQVLQKILLIFCNDFDLIYCIRYRKMQNIWTNIT